MGKSSRKKIQRNENDRPYSLNYGVKVGYRKRIIHEKEKRQEQEDALYELVRESQRLGLYEDQ